MDSLNIKSSFALVLCLILVSCSKDAEPIDDTPKLVLQITVDGLRADLISRYRKSFADSGGFNYLLNKGAVYTNAHYLHANTETIVGHTTLATGTHPSVHGMVGNVWYDSETGELGYNIEDSQAPILPTREIVTEGAQVDPAQLTSRTKGRSPREILASTISDEIHKNFNSESKIFGVSGKDRSAVSMAGHNGKAFWYSTDNGDFVTSKYYYSDYPNWVKSWNQERKAELFSDTKWELLNDISTYKFALQDDRSYEVDLKGYGKVFPHEFGHKTHPLFPTRILVSPKGDELILDFAKNLIVNEKIGKDDVTDYLSISFSSVDAVNHFFGPSSLENEDVVLQLDVTLKNLFNFIESEIGLENTLIVFSADHGMAEMPEYMNEQGYNVGRIYSDEIIERVNKIGVDKFGVDSVAKSFYRPSLYLNHVQIIKAELNLLEVEELVAKELTKTEGIYLAVGSNENSNQNNELVYKQIQNNYHPSRSGDIYVAQEPYWFLFEKGPIGVMHGSPWDYDTHVPIIFVGSKIPASVNTDLVHPIDVAPSIAAYLNIKAPKESVGNNIFKD